MRALITILFLFFSSISLAGQCQLTKETSRETLSCGNLKATLNTFVSGVNQLKLIFDDQFQLTLEVIDSDQQKVASAFYFNDKRKIPVLSQKEKSQILKMAQFTKQRSSLSKVHLFKFFMMLPANADLTSLQEASLRTPLRKSITEEYISICDLVGQKRRGFFNVDNLPSVFTRHVPVGIKSSNCYGRCGSGCDDGSPTYTQECLDHDICHRTTGENLGVCSDEWWLAAPGYMWAPYCNIPSL